ncbi:MAG: DUF1573 domain-containing protein [Patescibacteria group bacterium]
MDSFLFGIIVVTVLILGVAIFFGIKMGATSQVTADTQVTSSVDSNKFDWGTIDINDGIVSKEFVIQNTSNSTLKIYDVTTSCMCTTAQLKTSQATSKKYGMHEKSADVFEVKPEETAQLIVEFDPAFHGPSGVGPINRTITMRTNDTNHPQLSFNLTAVVVKK